MRNTGMRQNGGVEVLRVLLMFGITVLHQSAEFGVVRSFIGRLSEVCVVGFVFISGWYGIRFSFAKLVRLYGLGLFAAILTGIVLKFPSGVGDVVTSVVWFLNCFWFLHAYAVLMCLAPILNMPFENGVPESARRVVLVPTLVLVFGYCFVAVLPGVRDWLPLFAGCSTHGFLTLAGIYLASRWGRSLALDRLSVKHCAEIALLTAVPCGFGLGKFNSPFALLFAGALFLMFAKIRLPNKICSGFVFLGRSMFTVYLLQIGFVGLCIPPKIKMLCLSGYAGAFLSALAVFLVCLALDLVRRMVLAAILKMPLTARRWK